MSTITDDDALARAARIEDFLPIVRTVADWTDDAADTRNKVDLIYKGDDPETMVSITQHRGPHRSFVNFRPHDLPDLLDAFHRAQEALKRLDNAREAAR